MDSDLGNEMRWWGEEILRSSVSSVMEGMDICNFSSCPVHLEALNNEKWTQIVTAIVHHIIRNLRVSYSQSLFTVTYLHYFVPFPNLLWLFVDVDNYMYIYRSNLCRCFTGLVYCTTTSLTPNESKVYLDRLRWHRCVETSITTYIQVKMILSLPSI